MGDVAPTRVDPDLRAGAEWLGGPAGTHRGSPGFWTPLRVILLTGTAVFWLGVIRTVPCMVNGWGDPDRYEHLCYSDIPVLYSLRGLADGMVPYLEWPQGSHPLEYPVLIGLTMYVSALIVSVLGMVGNAVSFYLVTMVILYAFFLLALVAVSRTVTNRPWDGLLLALSPVVFFASTVNWDWPAIAFTAASLWVWSRKLPFWAGILLGLAIAAKFYPVLLLGPLLLLCLRAGRLGDWAKYLGGAVVGWLVVNIPFMIANTEGWQYFFTFSADRGQDFGSVWLAFQTFGFGVPADSINTVALVTFLVACIGIAVVILMAPTRPRVGQVSFLIVAAFLITNKVYSPQFVLWLLPLAILARPRWRDIIWWQFAEVIYFISIWWYLVGLTDGAKGLPEQWYAVAIMVHVLATLALAGLVVRDIFWPSGDPVRVDRPDHTDDPGGGVLDGAPDRFALRSSAG